MTFGAHAGSPGQCLHLQRQPEITGMRTWVVFLAVGVWHIVWLGARIPDHAVSGRREPGWVWEGDGGGWAERRPQCLRLWLQRLAQSRYSSVF